MERHFILPLSIAAALHAGLLFGIRGNPAAPSRGDDKPTMADVLLTRFEILPVVAPADDNAKPAVGTPVDPAPSAPEPPPPDSPPAFTVAVPDRPITALPREWTIPKGPPGIPDGVIDSNRRGLGDVLRGIDLDSPPRTRLQVPPEYPFAAKRDGRVGEVLVEFMVDEHGAVLDPRVVRSDDRVFEESALRAVSRWRFEPGRRAGQIVRFRMSVPFVFNLNES